MSEQSDPSAAADPAATVGDGDPALQPAPAAGIAPMEAGCDLACIQIAQSLALAVQDAVDHLRNVEAIAVTAQGTVLRRMLECPGPEGVEVLAAIQMMVSQGQDNLERISQFAVVTLGSLPR